MTEADILASTYDDLCSVYRPCKSLSEDGETEQLQRLVYEALPCSLSRPSGGRRQREQPTPKAGADYTLFVRPEVEIKVSDILEIHQQGRLIKGIAGRGFYYPSHNEIPVTLFKERV